MKKLILLSKTLLICSVFGFSGMSFSQPMEEEEEPIQARPNPAESRAAKTSKAATRSRAKTTTRANMQRPEGAPQLNSNRPEGAPQLPAANAVNQ